MPIQVLFGLEYGHGRFQAMHLAPLATKAAIVEPRGIDDFSDLRLQRFVPLPEFRGERPSKLNVLREQRLQREFLVGCQGEGV